MLCCSHNWATRFSIVPEFAKTAILYRLVCELIHKFVQYVLVLSIGVPRFQNGGAGGYVGVCLGWSPKILHRMKVIQIVDMYLATCQQQRY